MSFEVVEDELIDNSPKEIGTKSLRSMHLLKELNTVLEENENFVSNLGESDGKSITYINNLNKQLSEITRYLVKTLGVEYSELLEVDLSGGGIRFESDCPLDKSQSLKLDLVLVPEYYNLTTLGEVVDCQSIGSSGLYEIAITFSEIQEADRDAIIRHVFKRQSQQLRSDNKA